MALRARKISTAFEKRALTNYADLKTINDL